MSCCDPVVEKQMMVRTFGAVALVFGIIEFIIGLVVYTDLTSPQLGAWWAGLIIMIASFLGVVSLNRGVVLAACILASIGSVVGVIGSIVDGIASAVLDSLVACVSSTGIVSGDTSNYDDLYYSCYYSSYYNHDCSCSSPDSYTCYFYDGPLAVAGCDNILVKYTESLKAAVAFDVLATIAVFAFSVITCISLCAVSSSGTKTTVVGAGGAGLPPQQIVMVQPQQPIQVPVQYAQVPGQYPPQAYAQATPQGYAGVPVNVQYPPPGQAGVPANVQYPPQGYAEGYGQKA